MRTLELVRKQLDTLPLLSPTPQKENATVSSASQMFVCCVVLWLNNVVFPENTH
jgi:hypothetical protein